MGNTCYLNALLHVLARVECFRVWLSEHKSVHHDGQSEPTCMVCKLVDDINDITSTCSDTPLRPRIVLSRACWNPRFRNACQQDASEVWRSLLNTLDLVDVHRLEDLQLRVRQRLVLFVQDSLLCSGVVRRSLEQGLRQSSWSFNRLHLAV